MEGWIWIWLSGRGPYRCDGVNEGIVVDVGSSLTSSTQTRLGYSELTKGDMLLFIDVIDPAGDGGW